MEPGVLTVSATAPVGDPGYDLWIADYSSVGMSKVNVTAPCAVKTACVRRRVRVTGVNRPLKLLSAKSRRARWRALRHRLWLS